MYVDDNTNFGFDNHTILVKQLILFHQNDEKWGVVF